MDTLLPLDRKTARTLVERAEFLPTLKRKLEHNLERTGYAFRSCASEYAELAKDWHAAVVFSASVNPLPEDPAHPASTFVRKYRAAIKLGEFQACIIDRASLRLERHGNKDLRGFHRLDAFNVVYVGAKIRTGFDTVARSREFTMRSIANDTLDLRSSESREDAMARVTDALAFARMDDATLACAILSAVLRAGTLAILLPQASRTLSSAKRAFAPCCELALYIDGSHTRYARAASATEVADVIRPYLAE